ncbi:MAG: malate synthase A [Bradymonadia bacterium]|jgi:malate synthase
MLTSPEGVEIEDGDASVLTADALGFVADLVRRFAGRVDALLEARRGVQALYDAGALPDFAPETRAVREGEWTVAAPPPDLQDRRVEITGPTDRKMIINALNSGANVFMADCEDATSPTWRNVVEGQLNLRAAVRRTLTFDAAETGRTYRLAEKTATLFMRPRGLHLPEAHLKVDGRSAPGALVDFGLYAFHNAQALVAQGTRPYFYLPKLEHANEAQLWADVFAHTERTLGLEHGTIRATVLIETLPAAFQMNEILWALRDHSVGLNCGRWDYIFSYIKTLRAHGDRVLPDRAQVGMTQPNMRAYTQLVVQTCHRRGTFAMGGMAAQIPIKGDEARNATAMERVRADKLREVTDGHDGTWVAHPALVPIARAEFDAHLTTPNQIHRQRDDVHTTAAALLETPAGTRTEAGLRQNVRVGVQYLEAWLRGQGCVPLYDLMEDAATAEISRAQVWQWQHHGAALDDGRVVTPDLVRGVVADEVEALRARFTSTDTLERARALFEDLALAPTLRDFLTLAAYPQLSAD